jgi:hypothetical protein
MTLTAVVGIVTFEIVETSKAAVAFDTEDEEVESQPPEGKVAAGIAVRVSDYVDSKTVAVAVADVVDYNIAVVQVGSCGCDGGS